jgi:hypothetical protein
LRAKTVAIIVVLAALVSGGAVAAVMMTASDEDSSTRSLIPKNTFLYVEASRALSQEQRAACDELLAGFPDLGDCGSAAERIREALDEELGKEDLSFEDDIDSWLGDDFTFFMTTEGLDELVRRQSGGAQFETTSFSSQESEVLQSEEDGPMPSLGALASVDDEEAAENFIEDVITKEEEDVERRTYEGVEYSFVDDGTWAIFDGHLVVATEPGLKAVIDQRDAEESIEDGERFAAAEEAVRDDRLGFLYLDAKEPIQIFLESLPAMMPRSFFEPYVEAFEDPFTVTTFLEENGLVIETTGSSERSPIIAGAFPSDPDDTAREDMLRELPMDSWGALATGDLKEVAGSYLDLFVGAIPGGATALEAQVRQETGLDIQRDILGWMGESAIFLRGESARRFEAGIIVETSDPETALRTILRVRQLLDEENPTRIINRAGFRGFVALVPGQPQAGVVAVDDSRVVAALAPIGILDEIAQGRSLGDGTVVNDADALLGEDFITSAFFDVDAIRTLVEQSSPLDEMYVQQIQPFLKPLELLVLGSRVEGDVVRDRLVIGVE